MSEDTKKEPSLFDRIMKGNPNRKKAAKGKVKPGEKSLAEKINWANKYRKK